MFISLEPHIPTLSDIQYIHLDKESVGIQPRKKWVFWVLFFKLVLLTFQSHLLGWQNYL